MIIENEKAPQIRVQLLLSHYLVSFINQEHASNPVLGLSDSNSMFKKVYQILITF